jgi:hypothetical protein
VLVEGPEGKSYLDLGTGGKNNQMDIQRVGWAGMDWNYHT